VLQEIAGIAREYRVDHVATDQFSADALADISRDVGLDLAIHDIGAKDKHDLIKDVHTLMAERRLELPPNPQVRKDLQLVRRRVTQNGVAFHLPKTSDGRHCDYVPALALACHHAPDVPDSREPWLDPMERRRRLAAAEDTPHWEQVAERLFGGVRLSR
jgi:phage terminase large subunit-like protein